MLRPNYAWAIQVPEDDKRIKTEKVTVPSPNGTGHIDCYLVRPASARASRPPGGGAQKIAAPNPRVKVVRRGMGLAGSLPKPPADWTPGGGFPGVVGIGGKLF